MLYITNYGYSYRNQPSDDEESPTSLPADNTATNNDVVDGSIFDAFVAHSESINDGLSLSLFSVEEKVQIDLLQILKRLRLPLISYTEIMRWASTRSCLQGCAFHDVPIMSQKGGIDRLKLCSDINSLRPLVVKQLYLPYSAKVLCGSCILQCTFRFPFIPVVH